MLETIPQFKNVAFTQLRNADNQTKGPVMLRALSPDLNVKITHGAIMELFLNAYRQPMRDITINRVYVNNVIRAALEGFYRAQTKELDVMKTIDFVVSGIPFRWVVRYMEQNGKGDVEINSVHGWISTPSDNAVMYLTHPAIIFPGQVRGQGDQSIEGKAEFIMVPYSQWNRLITQLQQRYDQSHGKPLQTSNEQA